MRKLAAILLLVIFASLNAIDGICCPEGCTHEEEVSSTTSLHDVPPDPLEHLPRS